MFNLELPWRVADGAVEAQLVEDGRPQLPRCLSTSCCTAFPYHPVYNVGDLHRAHLRTPEFRTRAYGMYVCTVTGS